MNCQHRRDVGLGPCSETFSVPSTHPLEGSAQLPTKLDPQIPGATHTSRTISPQQDRAGDQSCQGRLPRELQVLAHEACSSRGHRLLRQVGSSCVAGAEGGRAESRAGGYLQLEDESHRRRDQTTSTRSPRDRATASDPLPQSPVAHAFPLSIHLDAIRERRRGRRQRARAGFLQGHASFRI